MIILKGTLNLTNGHGMTAHNYANLQRITFYIRHCAVSYQGDDLDISHYIDRGPLKLTIPREGDCSS